MRPRVVETILLGGLAVATLDIVNAMTFWALHRGTGPIYGAVVYFIMNHVIVPLSQARPAPFILAWFLDNLIGHLILVGPPIAFIARRSALRRQR